MGLAFRDQARATLTLLGTIIGAGIFGIPVAMSTFGIFYGSILFWILTGIVLLTHLLYAELIVSRRALASHRFPGQMGELLGSWAQWIATVTHPAHLLGACVAYVLLGGQFLGAIAEAWGVTSDVDFWKAIFLIVGMGMTSVGLRFIAKMESWLTTALILMLVVSTGFVVPQADPRLFFQDWWSPNLPSVDAAMTAIGIFIFSVFGLSIITQIAELRSFEKERTRTAVAMGTLGAALLTWGFGTFIFAAGGPELAQTPARFSSLFPVGFQTLIPWVGFLAVFTSFATLFEEVKLVCHREWGWSSPFALAAAGAALIGSLVLLENPLRVMSYIGGVFVALNAMLACLASLVAFRSRASVWYRVVPVACLMVFALIFLFRLGS